MSTLLVPLRQEVEFSSGDLDSTTKVVLSTISILSNFVHSYVLYIQLCIEYVATQADGTMPPITFKFCFKLRYDSLITNEI